MPSITLKLVNTDGEIKKSRSGEQHTYLDFIGSFEKGDLLKISVDEPGQYLMVQADEALNPSLIYLKEQEWTYHYPLSEEELRAFPKNAFIGEKKYMHARFAEEDEINRYRNLALNPHDQKQDSGGYPHAWANVETRNDSTFFARNAIDGIIANESHGSYPYQSWGINKKADAFLQLEFGRRVHVDRMALILRGDYPHDSYWTQVTAEFSDGTEEVLKLVKVHEAQVFSIAPRDIEWLKLKNLIKNDDDSPFPALTELEVYGDNHTSI
ncbi:hypothetical protein NIE88_02550 [Sporolactobacillus shoreicorticis]|uniref:Carbohydrate-binding protein n=1 Tax=Sporolactobacillus shoreicorticis TaxID=1923877 RepID=A0ABW5S0Z8_9BACL|nr:hypothetical protein [Sporolactobacillus shoreicorticis]MCO7124660.1 hypothetical protein [Sporolactobacillus shoreicorticis]